MTKRLRYKLDLISRNIEATQSCHGTLRSGVHVRKGSLPRLENVAALNLFPSISSRRICSVKSKRDDFLESLAEKGALSMERDNEDVVLAALKSVWKDDPLLTRGPGVTVTGDATAVTSFPEGVKFSSSDSIRIQF